MKTLLFALLLPVAASAKLKAQLELFFEISHGDSVISIEQTAVDSLTVYLQVSEGGKPSHAAQVPPHVIQKLFLQAGAEGVPIVRPSQEFLSKQHAEKVNLQPADTAGVPEELLSQPTEEPHRGGELFTGKTTSEKELKKNRRGYVISQTIFSSYVYGFAVPSALSLSGDKVGATTLLAVPGSFLTHFFMAKDKDYYDSHINGTNYFSFNALILSYGLSFLALGPDNNAFRTANFAVLAAYPTGLYLGYKHGTRFQENPGRIMLQSGFAGVLGTAGLLAAIS